MYLIYIDDSADEKLAIYSALAIPENEWRKSFEILRNHRKKLRDDYGIYVYKELHAWEFVSGRGKISDHVVTKFERVSIFNETLKLMSSLPGAKMLNVVKPKADKLIAYEWLLNRINRFLEKNHGILICDQGNELQFTRLARRLMVHNPIRSKYGVWSDTGKTWKNVPIDRILEDPIFKPSDQSYFIQLCDFAAYALLRRENPLESKTKYGLDLAT